MPRHRADFLTDNSGIESKFRQGVASTDLSHIETNSPLLEHLWFLMHHCWLKTGHGKLGEGNKQHCSPVRHAERRAGTRAGVDFPRP